MGKLDSLTEEERIIAEMIADGKAIKEISYRLGYTKSQTETRISRILEKSGASNRVNLAYYVGLERLSG